MNNKLKRSIITSLIISNWGILGINAQAHMNSPLITKPQKLGYALGMEMGRSLKKMNPDIELKSLLKGIMDSYTKRPLKLTDKEANAIRNDFRHHRLITDKIWRKQDELIRKELEKTDKKRANKKPLYSLDMSMVDQSAPTKAAWSFVILYNNIMPVFTEKHIDKICAATASKDFTRDCKSLLLERLNFLKKDIRENKIALFSAPKIITEAGKRNHYILTWRETFQFENGQKTKSQKKLAVQTIKAHNKWYINNASFIQ